MASTLSILLLLTLLNPAHSDNGIHQPNGIPLYDPQAPQAESYDYQQLPPQYLHAKLVDKEDTSADKDPANQCALVNQIQSVVIQILSTHYEYGKGIHTLHALVDNIQHDVAALKSDLKDTAKSHGKLLSKLGLDEENITKLLDQQSQLVVDNKYDKTKNLIEHSMSNITSLVSAHTSHLARLEKRHKSLRRTLTKVLSDMAKLQDADDTREVNELLTHFIDKQKEVNANLVSRVRNIEEQSVSDSRRSLRHQQHLTQNTIQNDSPTNKQNTDCPRGFYQHLLSCYSFVNLTKTWIEAEKHCQTLHSSSHLAGIETPAEQEFIMQYRNHNAAYWTSAYIWVGGTDMISPPYWSWVGTSRLMTYTNWRPGEPSKQQEKSGSAGDPYCMYFRSQQIATHGIDPRDGQWDDWHCNAASLNFVCEIQLHL